MEQTTRRFLLKNPNKAYKKTETTLKIIEKSSTLKSALLPPKNIIRGHTYNTSDRSNRPIESTHINIMPTKLIHFLDFIIYLFTSQT